MPEEERFRPAEYKISAEKQVDTVLGSLESEVMEVAWECGDDPFTVREAFERMKESRKIAYTTVMTTMNALHRKGLLSRRVTKGKGGLLYRYQTTMNRKELGRETVRNVLQSLFRNFGREALTSGFLDEVEISPSELEELIESKGGSEDENENES